jgi:acyl-CoA thioesterase FadM
LYGLLLVESDAARTVQVMYDYTTATPVPIPDDIRRKMQES